MIDSLSLVIGPPLRRVLTPDGVAATWQRGLRLATVEDLDDGRVVLVLGDAEAEDVDHAAVVQTASRVQGFLEGA